MRKYGKEKKIEQLICNKCGKEIKVHHGIIQEGVFQVDYLWNYFSNKDGEIQRFDLCEECYDQMIAAFRYMPEKEEATELL